MSETQAKPWWQSKTVLGVIVMAAASGLQTFGIAELTASDQAVVVDWLLSAVGIGAAGFAVWGRIVASQRIG
jgi:hypothetical protein